VYMNDTGHPILYYRDTFNKSESAGKMLGYGGNNNGNPSFQGSGTICSQPEFYFAENYYEVKYDYGDAAKGELSFPATAPAAYADRIYIDRKDHTYQMPRPVRKGCLFDGWDNWDDWHWGWLASHGASKREDIRHHSVSNMTDDAYTYTMNFVTTPARPSSPALSSGTMARSWPREPIIPSATPTTRILVNNLSNR